jgi:hypothetical protein
MTQSQRIISIFTAIGFSIGLLISNTDGPGIQPPINFTDLLINTVVMTLVGFVLGIMYARLVNPYTKR